ncbi:MAG: DUF4238 domain-containing protein, partial [Phyllobacteriaceae bacterium]|nr:DUF4238 domain-containing protein [Phyllobacteriaceae bacterium]
MNYRNKLSRKPERHHYFPQFFLRNFAIDDQKKKVMALHKLGSRAEWAKKSIESIAFEYDLYVHMDGSTPISVEEKINADFETPISQTDTWKKISTGGITDLDASDRAVLYSLVRNFEVRTPHYRNTLSELSLLAGRPDSGMKFSDEEKAMYAELRADPRLMSECVNKLAFSTEWTARDFSSCSISVWRVCYPVYVCTTPVHVFPISDHPALRASQAGVVAHSYLMPLTPNAYVSLTLGDFDGEFSNEKVSAEVEIFLKRHIVSQFSYWPTIRHMICNDIGLVDNVKFAGYNCTMDSFDQKRFLCVTIRFVHTTSL